MRVTRLGDGPIIGPDADPSIGVNIQGPSLIRVPDWAREPLGAVLPLLRRSQGRLHPAGLRRRRDRAVDGARAGGAPARRQPIPDDAARGDRRAAGAAGRGLHVDLRDEQLVARTCSSTRRRRTSRPPTCTSMTPAAVRDVLPRPGGARRAGHPCGDVDRRRRVRRATRGARPAVHAGVRARRDDLRADDARRVLRSADGLSGFEEGPTLFQPEMRHSAVVVRGDMLHVFWTRVGDAPESILWSTIELTPRLGRVGGDRTDRSAPARVRLGGGRRPARAVERSTAYGTVNQLRDPALLRGGRSELPAVRRRGGVGHRARRGRLGRLTGSAIRPLGVDRPQIAKPG